MIRYALPVIVALASLPAVSGAQSRSDCPCTPYPFSPDPPCFNICAATVLNTSSREEVFGVLDLPEETQAEIVEVQGNATLPVSLDEGYSENAQRALRATFDQANRDELLKMLTRVFAN